MFEYHGWITFVYSPYDVEHEEEKLDTVISYAKNFIKQVLNERHIAELKVINAEYMASFAGAANHRSPDVEAVIEFFEEIAKRATGSYGLLYIWDDEVPDFDDRFQVERLARGEFKLVKDHYLSPRIPTLEDPYEF